MRRLLICGMLTAVFVSFCAYGQEPNETPKSLGPKTNSQQTFETESLSKLLSSSVSDKEKREILNQLFESENKAAAPYLVKFLAIKGQRAGLYETTLYLLSRMGDKSVVEAVKPMLYHPDIYVRRQAAITLNTLGDRSGIAIMISSLESKSRNSRSVANAALREITGQDFADGKSLRIMTDAEEKSVINKWKNWLKENKDAAGLDKVGDFSKVLAGEEAAMRMRYTAMEEEEKNNPELPMFENAAKTPKVTFERFKSAILENDIKTALSLMGYPLKEKYEKIFEQMGEHRHGYAEGLGRIYFDTKVGNILYYEMVTEQDDGRAAFPVHFVQDDNGDWLIIVF
jgi:hypothetical protein